jgi:hypothetical protein
LALPLPLPDNDLPAFLLGWLPAAAAAVVEEDEDDGGG